ncbi:Methyltransferase domain-containing protein [Chryseolinea serpens]|uniref:Methyltransferase domain-containing protein n=1 Tax=Chryseolinea serpens TaxID=947013 RepID=A0A1M5M6F2_9BACT|nr:class I SAM-dependent methyltransferase [Chryseolinea serpens]SHG72874.1 Methyltransferase domain-containing protein [Chryseolinea serpens]
MMKQINYGIDGPKFVRNLFLFVVIFYATALAFPRFQIGQVTVNTFALTFCLGSLCLAEGVLMLLYAWKGKFAHRDRILNLVHWKGHETVLDVGTGLGLLMIGAAKRLTSGNSIGIDIWNKDDLSENSFTKASKNAVLENVANKIELKEENILQTSFQNNHFDVVLSNLCLHNVGDKENRKTACREIHRILKKGGVAIISDIVHHGEYKAAFQELGMTTEKVGTFYLNTYQPLTIIKAVKN